MKEVSRLGFTAGPVSSVWILHSIVSCHTVLGVVWGSLFPVFLVFWTQVLGIPLCSAIVMHRVCSGLSFLVLFGVRRRLEVSSAGGKQNNNWKNKWDQYLICSQPAFFKASSVLISVGDTSLSWIISPFVHQVNKWAVLLLLCRSRDGCLTLSCWKEREGGPEWPLWATFSVQWPGWPGYFFWPHSFSRLKPHMSRWWHGAEWCGLVATWRRKGQ